MNYEHNPTKQNNIIYFLIGFLLPMFLIVCVSAQQPTIKELTEQELDTITQTRETISGAGVQLNDDLLQPSNINKLTNKQSKPSNNQTSQGGNQNTIPCEEITLHNELATEIARYMCKINPDADMLATFMQESGFNPRAKGSAGERGICQLMPNRTNNVWINDERWNDWKWQSERCIEKWKAVPSKGVIWMAYAVRAKYLHLFKS